MLIVCLSGNGGFVEQVMVSFPEELSTNISNIKLKEILTITMLLS